ncbi:MAG: DUF2953 domain-containing protein [Firmicutes bacterium]|nr:DUF2953 domain-containing protein [Bacillota bacterium]
MLTFIALVFILLLVPLVIMPLRIRIRYKQENFDDLVILEMGLWKLPTYKLTLPKLDLKAKISGVTLKTSQNIENSGELVRKIVTTLLGMPGKEDNMANEEKKVKIPFNITKIKNRIKKQKKLYHRNKPAIQYLLNHVKCTQLKWKTNFGVGDAATTGWLTGLIWTGKTTVLTKLFSLVIPPNHQPKLEVQPKFNKNELIINFDCIFEVRIVHIMVTGIKILLIRINFLNKTGV